MQDLLRAVSLMILLEGLLPFVAPARFRGTLLRVAQLDDRAMRALGALSLLMGLIGLQVAHWLL